MLGKELVKKLAPSIAPIGIWNPSRKAVDITNELTLYSVSTLCSLIIHCAAYTDVLKAETEKDLCYQTNVIGTRNLASLGIPMLYISTEYVFDGQKGSPYVEEDYPNPVNFYSFTKLLGEYESRRTRSVVVRLLFKPKPFKHDSACTDQISSGMYADEAAKEITHAVKLFDKLPPTLHVGFGGRSTFQIARETRPDVKETTIEEIFKKTGLRLPKDTSLNCSKWEAIKSDYKT